MTPLVTSSPDITTPQLPHIEYSYCDVPESFWKSAISGVGGFDTRGRHVKPRSYSDFHFLSIPPNTPKPLGVGF